MVRKKRAKKRGGLSPDRYLNGGQLKKLRGYVREKADLARSRGGSRSVIVELLVNTGLRASELCSLNIGDLPAKHGKDCIWVRDGKGKVSRTVDISQKLRKRLDRFVKLYRKGARANSPLLVSEQGGRIIYRSIYSKVKRIGGQAGRAGYKRFCLTVWRR